MAWSIIYKRKGKKRENTLDTIAQVGVFVIANQPLEVIAVREQIETSQAQPFNPDNVAGYHPDQSPQERKRRTGL